ncbi:MAG: hypothetical protein IT372_03675 [Polyangiaceae bacterium]|nr:hypothetical protein [Polyangiaceae bacterium]
MTEPRPRWIAFGNIATGFIAIGNVVTGVIAIGNVARGFIAVGNVAVGVIAIGNVGLGIAAGFGATISLGLVSGAGVLTLPVLAGVAGIANLGALTPAVGLVPILAWIAASYLLPGERAPRPEPALTPLRRVLSGEVAGGWIRARAERMPDGALRLRAGFRTLGVPASPEALDALEALGPGRPEVIARLGVEERLRGEAEGGYRDAAPRERVLVCASILPAPPPVLPWSTHSEVQWWLARAWRAGALVGAVLLAVKLLVL